MAGLTAQEVRGTGSILKESYVLKDSKPGSVSYIPGPRNQ